MELTLLGVIMKGFRLNGEALKKFWLASNFATHWPEVAVNLRNCFSRMLTEGGITVDAPHYEQFAKGM
jgi:hypothetical protein